MFSVMVIGIVSISVQSANGRNDFHVKFISRSYRMRGRVARIHTNIQAIIMVFVVNMMSLIIIVFVFPERMVAEMRLIIKMLAYSAIKIMANEPLLYSVLNPDTSSDSPSAKSNGVRFVSARVVVSHIKVSGIDVSSGHVKVLFRMVSKLNEAVIIRNEIRIKAILTSYEIVCATLRRAPKRAYFLFDVHPAAMVV